MLKHQKVSKYYENDCRLPKADKDGWKMQLREMQSTKVIMTLWFRWKKSVKSVITLDPEDVEGAQNIENNICDKYIKVEMTINSLMTEFFEGRNMEELIRRIFVHVKSQVGNHRMPGSGLILDHALTHQRS